MPAATQAATSVGAGSSYLVQVEPTQSFAPGPVPPDNVFDFDLANVLDNLMPMPTVLTGNNLLSLRYLPHDTPIMMRPMLDRKHFEKQLQHIEARNVYGFAVGDKDKYLPPVDFLVIWATSLTARRVKGLRPQLLSRFTGRFVSGKKRITASTSVSERVLDPPQDFDQERFWQKVNTPHDIQQHVVPMNTPHDILQHVVRMKTPDIQQHVVHINQFKCAKPRLYSYKTRKYFFEIEVEYELDYSNEVQKVLLRTPKFVIMSDRTTSESRQLKGRKRSASGKIETGDADDKTAGITKKSRRRTGSEVACESPEDLSGLEATPQEGGNIEKQVEKYISKSNPLLALWQDWKTGNLKLEDSNTMISLSRHLIDKGAKEQPLHQDDDNLFHVLCSTKPPPGSESTNKAYIKALTSNSGGLCCKEDIRDALFAQNKWGQNPLQNAVYKRRNPLAEYLLTQVLTEKEDKRNVVLNRTKTNSNMLHSCCDSGNHEFLNFLLESKFLEHNDKVAMLHERNGIKSGKKTPLEMAVFKLKQVEGSELEKDLKKLVKDLKNAMEKFPQIAQESSDESAEFF
ncbi:hypothetical protein HK102_002058 [Quaeritorhiza haematococci]|nr:hypothetical protein HK102_002058 [Quaeritorhiza haematococci]